MDEINQSSVTRVRQVTIGYFNGTIVSLNGGHYTFPYGENQTSNVQWTHISEQNISYLLPLQQLYESFGVQVGNKTGNYAEASPYNVTVTARIVTLYINHDYNYMISPIMSQ